MALLLGGLAANAAPQKQHLDLSIRIMPQVVDGRVLNIKVSETFDQPSTPAGTPLLSMPIITDSVPGVLNDASTFSARDALGPLPLQQVDDPVDPTETKQDHHWLPLRRTSGPITVTYLASPRAITPDTKPAALTDMRVEAPASMGRPRCCSLSLSEDGRGRCGSCGI